MKVKCIIGSTYLTIGRIYDVINVFGDIGYEIIDDWDHKCLCYKSEFKPLSEIRNEKIDKLLTE